MKAFGHLVILSILFYACQSETEAPAVDCSSSTLDLDLINITEANCGQATGEIVVSATGGTTPYRYSLNTGPQNSDGVFSQLNAAGYTVSVTDKDNCSVNLTATVNNMNGVALTGTNTTNSGCGAEDGSITVNAEAGEPPYQYFLNNGTPQDENVFESLAQGIYTVHVIDMENCEITTDVKVESGITWTGEIKDIIMTKCALPECHGGTQTPDYRQFSNVKSHAADIKRRTGEGSMPPTGPLSADLVEKIACWVDDGANQN